MDKQKSLCGCGCSIAKQTVNKPAETPKKADGEKVKDWKAKETK